MHRGLDQRFEDATETGHTGTGRAADGTVAVGQNFAETRPDKRAHRRQHYRSQSVGPVQFRDQRFEASIPLYKQLLNY